MPPAVPPIWRKLMDWFFAMWGSRLFQQYDACAQEKQRNRVNDIKEQITSEPNDPMSIVIRGDQVGNKAENIKQGIMIEANNDTNKSIPDDEMHGGTRIAPHPSSIQHIETISKFLFWIAGVSFAALFFFAAACIVELKFDSTKIFFLFTASLMATVIFGIITVFIIYACRRIRHFVAVATVMLFTTIGAALTSLIFCFILILK